MRSLSSAVLFLVALSTAACATELQDEPGSARSSSLTTTTTYLEVDGATVPVTVTSGVGMPGFVRPGRPNDPITLAVPMGSPIKDWIESSLSMNYQRKSGEIVSADAYGHIVERLAFDGALITEVGFPAVDGAAKDPAYMTVKFEPTYTRYKREGGTVSGPTNEAQKSWNPANFRISISGIDAVASSVDAMKMTAKEPGKLEIPNLEVTFVSEVPELFRWHEDFVIEGNNEQGKEKTGLIEFLSANREAVLRLLCVRLGIRAVSTTDGRTTAQMYCDELAAAP